jgi:Mrp family chromosome partitioning ATPase/capsular polysaccharide biosynthesis protein
VTADLHAYRALLARRWTVIVPAVVLVPLLTLVLALRQEKVYSASAQVLLTYTNVGASVNGIAPAYPATAPDRNVATQAALARDPAVAREALNLSHVRSTASDLLNESSVTSSSSADILNFSVNDSSPARAMTLATNYARAYTLYRGRIDSQAISSSLAGISRQLNALVASGQTGTSAYRFLSRDQQALSATQAAGTNDTVLSQRAQNASDIGPHAARSAALGLVIGIALAIALVFLMETLDKRASVEEIEQRLSLSSLAAIPSATRWRRAAGLIAPLAGLVAPLRERIRRGTGAEPAAALGGPGNPGGPGVPEAPVRPPAAKRSRAVNGSSRAVNGSRARTRVAGASDVKQLPAATPDPQEPATQEPETTPAPMAVVRDPNGRTAEAYRVLKSSLEFASLEHDFKSLLLTSARSYRGKSETAANLAVTLVQSGRRVLLCDLDAGRTSVSDLFGLEERVGMTEVALGQTTLEDAIVSIPTASLQPLSRSIRGNPPRSAEQANGHSATGSLSGELKVLPFGCLPPYSGFLGTRAVTDLVEGLRYAHADLVLIEAPPLLSSGEAQTLSALADALIVAVADPVRPSMLGDLAATLSRLPAFPLGFISVGLDRERDEWIYRGPGGAEDVTAGALERLPAAPNGHNGSLPAASDIKALRRSATHRSRAS